MTPTHEHILKRLKEVRPNARDYAVHLDYSVHPTGITTHIFLHAGKTHEMFDSYADLADWFNKRVNYRKENEILFRKF